MNVKFHILAFAMAMQAFARHLWDGKVDSDKTDDVRGSKKQGIFSLRKKINRSKY